MSKQDAIKFIDETEKFIEKCHKAYINKYQYMSSQEYEHVRQFKNFLLSEIDVTKELIEKNENA